MRDLLQWRVLWKLDVICSDSGSQRMTTWGLLSYRSAAEGRVVQLLCWGVVPGHRLACWWGHFPFGETVHEAGWSTSFPWRTPLLAASTHMGFCWTCSDREIVRCATAGTSRMSSSWCKGGDIQHVSGSNGGQLQSVPVDWALTQAWSTAQEWFDLTTLLFSKPEQVKLSNEGWVYNIFGQDTFCR